MAPGVSVLGPAEEKETESGSKLLTERDLTSGAEVVILAMSDRRSVERVLRAACGRTLAIGSRALLPDP